MTLGGEGSLGYVPTEETRKKLSIVHKGKPFSEEHKRKIRESNKGKNLGKHQTEETRKKLSTSLIGNQRNKGKHHTEETKKILSESHKGDKNPHYGKRHTEEAKMKMSASKKGKHLVMIDGKRHYE